MRKIRELGSLPSDAFEKYQNNTLKQVMFIVPMFATLSAQLDSCIYCERPMVIDSLNLKQIARFSSNVISVLDKMSNAKCCLRFVLLFFFFFLIA